MKILLTNVFNFYNRGEMLQVEALTQNIKANYGLFSVFSYLDPQKIKKYNLEVLGHKRREPLFLPFFLLWFGSLLIRSFLWRIFHFSFFLNKTLKKIRSYDFIVDLGGDTFSDKPNILYSLSHIIVLFLMMSLDKKYIILSQTIGVFPFTQILARYILKNATRISVRDYISAQRLYSLGINQITIAPDIAFLINHNRIDTKNFIIGFNVSPLICKVQIPHSFVKLINKLSDFAEILFIPHVVAPVKRTKIMRLRDDRVVLKQIYENFEDRDNVSLVDSFDDIGDSIAKCDLFIGGRFHSVVYAISLGIPSILLGYSEKAESFASYFDFKDCYISIDSDDFLIQLETKIYHMLENISSFKIRFIDLRNQTRNEALKHVRMLRMLLND